MTYKSSQENLIKNAIIIVIAILCWPVISEALSQIKPQQINDFLLVISMLLVTVCFANFAFTYEKTKLKVTSVKLLSHSATFIFMLLIALLLESMVFSIKVVYPSFYNIILIFAAMLYLGIVLYDFWDYLRIEE